MRESFDDENEDLGYSPIDKYERMLANDDLIYFDITELEEIVEHYLDNDEQKKALRTCDFGLNQHPNNVSLLILKGEIFIELDQSKKALEILQRTVNLSPENPDVYASLGSLYSHLKSPKEAIFYYEKSLTFLEGEEKIDVLMDVAYEYQNLRQFENALDQLKEVLHLSSSNEAAMFEAGFCYGELNGLEDDAIAFFTNYLDDNPYSYIGWFNLANCHMKKEEYDEAIFAFDYSAIINEYFPASFYGKANAHIQKGEFQNAIEVLNETFELEQPHAFVYCTIGECYEKLKDLDQALLYYKKSTDVDKEYSDAWVGMGVIHKLKKQFDQALKYMDKGLDLDPGNIEFLLIKAGIYEDLKRVDDAMYIYYEILDIDTTNELAWFNLGTSFAEKKMYDAAEDALELGYDKTKAPDIKFKLIAVLFEMGEEQEALAQLEEALEDHIDAVDFLYEYFPEYKKNATLIALLKKYNLK